MFGRFPSRVPRPSSTALPLGRIGPALLAAALLLAGCGAGPVSKPAGTADVAYAGALQVVNDQFLGPAFEHATGNHYRGRGGGAFGVAHLIATGEIHPNVFESMGTGPIKLLEPKFTRWSVALAANPLVIAYSPRSRWAPEFQAIAHGKKPLADLFRIMEQPGFHLGRTNPQTDPQGQAFIFMIHLARGYLHLPPGTATRILGGVNNPRQIFAEESILSHLQSGQLDASSAFLPEAIQRHLPYIRLPGRIDMGDPAYASLYRTQSLRLKSGTLVHGSPMVVYVTQITGTPDQTTGLAYLRFLFSPTGKHLLRQEGYLLVPPTIQGDKTAVPPSLRHLLAKG